MQEVGLRKLKPLDRISNLARSLTALGLVVALHPKLSRQLGPEWQPCGDDACAVLLERLRRASRRCRSLRKRRTLTWTSLLSCPLA